MARIARSNKVFSNEFVKAVKTAVNDNLARNDFETCVSAADLADHKAVAKAFKVKNSKRLRILVMTLVSVGQVPGLRVRKGRDGGVYRVKVKARRSRKPVTKTATPANDAQTDTAVSA